MNKKITTLILGILLLGVISAGLVAYLSNVVSGTVTVEGPVFYLNGYNSGIYHDLLINEIPSSEEDVYLWDGQRLMFNTEELGVENFYRARFDIKIWAKTNISGNIMQFQVVRIKPDLSEEIICIPPVIIISSWYDEFRERDTSCESSGEIELNPDDKIGLIIMGAGAESDYYIRTGHNYTNGYSRIEVSAI